jgi:hypothetical protein
MPPQAPAPTQVSPTAVPGGGTVNPNLIRALLMRRAQMGQGGATGAPGAGTAPNAMDTAAPAIPQGGVPNVMARRPGAANPAQSVMKAAQQAQSPLVADTGTRALAKALIQKLMQHM